MGTDARTDHPRINALLGGLGKAGLQHRRLVSPSVTRVPSEMHRAQWWCCEGEEPHSCQGNFIKRELPARWGPGPSTEFQDVPPRTGRTSRTLYRLWFAVGSEHSRVHCDPRRQAGEGARQLTLALALASSLHLRLEDLPT